MPKVNTTAKVMKDGQAFIQPIYDTGEFGELSGLPAAEKLMQINRGGQVDLANPYSGEAQKSLPISISPGEQARLAQSERHFGASHGLARQNNDLQRQRLMLEMDPEYQAQKAGLIAGAKESSKLKVGAAASLPQTLGVLAESLNLSDALKNHPALNQMVGNFPTRTIGKGLAMYGGNDEADFSAKLEQAQGKQFLSAIEGMRGFGQLTEIEGDKMQASAAAMSIAQSPQDFKRAQDEYQAALLSGVRKVAFKLGVPEEKILEMLNNERSTLKKDSGNSGNNNIVNSPDHLWGDVR
jgi:hypothetical protein